MLVIETWSFFDKSFILRLFYLGTICKDGVLQSEFKTNSIYYIFYSNGVNHFLMSQSKKKTLSNVANKPV